jgi:hypothetical protein
MIRLVKLDTAGGQTIKKPSDSLNNSLMPRQMNNCSQKSVKAQQQPHNMVSPPQI